MIVRVNDLVLPAFLAEDLERPIRHHLVGVHVGRSSSAALDHVDTEVFVVPTFSDLASGLRNRIDDFAVEELHLEIGERRRFFYAGQRGDERRKLTKLDSTDREILDRAQCLDSIQRRRRHVALAKHVTLSTSWSGEIDS